MIVTCERCSTQFQLDDAKVPESGIQVQCSRCEHVFAIGPEARPDADSPEDLAVDALLSDSRSDFDSGGGDLLADGADPDGESDWEFNDDGVIADSMDSEELTEDRVAAESELSIAEEAVDDLLANVGDMDSFDDAVPDDAELEAGDPLGGFELEESESDLAEAESVVESPVIESPVFESPVIEPAPVADVSEGIGDPDDWDIFDEPSGPTAQTYAMSSEAASGEAGARLEPAVDISVPLEAGNSKMPGWMVHARVVTGWTIVSVLLLIGLHGGLSSRSDAVQSGPGHWTGGGFEVDQLEGRWVDNSVAGPIYVVSGRLRRVAGAAASSGSRLEIRLVDAKGRTLDWGPAPIGPAIPNRVLHESDPSELDSRQSSRAARFAVGAASWRPFEAVLAGLPDSADRFELGVSGGPAG